MVDFFDVFDRSVGKYDSELDRTVSLFAQCVVDLLVVPVSVVGVDPLQHRFPARKALRRIKPPDAESLLRPIENCRLAIDRGTGAAQPLCFRQMGFAAAQSVFSVLAFMDVNGQAIPLDDVSFPVPQRLTANVVPTIFAVRPTQAQRSLVRPSRLNCVVEGPYTFWQVVGVE